METKKVQMNGICAAVATAWQVLFFKIITLKYKIFYSQRSLGRYGKNSIYISGQGAQYVGMGQDFYDTMPVCRQVMDKAGEITGLDIPKICFTENEEIHITEYTQIAMLSVEAAILKALEQEGLVPDVSAGLSLGEYGACIASGVLSLEDAFFVVRKRGIFMQEAVPSGGAMSAVMGTDATVIEQACQETEALSP